MVGLDYSQAFIAKCQELQKLGQAGYFLATEGVLGQEKTACIDTSIVRDLAGLVYCSLIPSFHSEALLLWNEDWE